MNEYLNSSCTEAISRMSNLGMAIKTAGVTLFGAGVANYLGADSAVISCNLRYAYCGVLALLGSLFIYMDISYLSRERAFREIQKLLHQNNWGHEFLDPSLIYDSIGNYPKVKKSWCLLSFSVFPIILFEATTVLLLLTIR